MYTEQTCFVGGDISQVSSQGNALDITGLKDKPHELAKGVFVSGVLLPSYYRAREIQQCLPDGVYKFEDWIGRTASGTHVAATEVTRTKEELAAILKKERD